MPTSDPRIAVSRERVLTATLDLLTETGLGALTIDDVSRRSGVGVEELSEGEGKITSLLGSAFAFVLGFSIVFIMLGASASAVGSFLLRNRSLLAPLAGAMILLFGLHLLGALNKISIRIGLIVGAILVAAGILLLNKPEWTTP